MSTNFTLGRAVFAPRLRSSASMVCHCSHVSGVAPRRASRLLSPSGAATSRASLPLSKSATLDVVFDHPPPERLAAQLREMLLMLADEPQLADMCLRAMLASEKEVSKARRHIGSEVDRRIRAALGTSAWPEVVDLFGFGLYGAVLQANYSAVSADELAAQLTDLVDIVLSQSA
jgi:hypothetical protein